MAMRNFWMEARIDGRETRLSGGPRGKEGGLHMVIRQRKNGESVPAVEINCYEHNGQLCTSIFVDGVRVGQYITER